MDIDLEFEKIKKSYDPWKDCQEGSDRAALHRELSILARNLDISLHEIWDKYQTWSKKANRRSITSGGLLYV